MGRHEGWEGGDTAETQKKLAEGVRQKEQQQKEKNIRFHIRKRNNFVAREIISRSARPTRNITSRTTATVVAKNNPATCNTSYRQLHGGPHALPLPVELERYV